jgi:hypothetical protein
MYFGRVIPIRRCAPRETILRDKPRMYVVHVGAMESSIAYKTSCKNRRGHLCGYIRQDECPNDARCHWLVSVVCPGRVLCVHVDSPLFAGTEGVGDDKDKGQARLRRIEGRYWAGERVRSSGDMNNE